MTDRDNRSDHIPRVPETLPSENRTYQVQKLDVVLPLIEWQNDLQSSYNLSPKKEAVYKTKAEKFAESATVVVLTGLWGMGDSLISVRFAINMAKQTHKKVICQVHPALLAFGEQLKHEVPNLQLVDRVASEHLSDEKSFVMRFLQGGGRIDEVARWADGDVSTNSLAIAQKISENKTLDLEDLTVPATGDSEAFPDPFGPIHTPPESYSSSYYLAAFLSQSIGVPVSSQDLQSVSVFAPTEEEVAAVPQDLEYIFIPDAKEFPDNNDFRSYKSFDLRMWKRIFHELPKGQKMSVVLGVSHPDYCQAVIDLARQEGHEVEVLEGDLKQLAHHLLRAKKIVGMDSGTTHLAKDVQTAARRAGRHIGLLPLFNTQISHFEQYGIVQVDSFNYSEENQQVALAVVEYLTQ